MVSLHDPPLSSVFIVHSDEEWIRKQAQSKKQQRRKSEAVNRAKANDALSQRGTDDKVLDKEESLILQQRLEEVLADNVLSTVTESLIEARDVKQPESADFQRNFDYLSPSTAPAPVNDPSEEYKGENEDPKLCLVTVSSSVPNDSVLLVKQNKRRLANQRSQIEMKPSLYSRSPDVSGEHSASFNGRDQSVFIRLKVNDNSSSSKFEADQTVYNLKEVILKYDPLDTSRLLKRDDSGVKTPQRYGMNNYKSYSLIDYRRSLDPGNSRTKPRNFSTQYVPSKSAGKCLPIPISPPFSSEFSPVTKSDFDILQSSIPVPYSISKTYGRGVCSELSEARGTLSQPILPQVSSKFSPVRKSDIQQSFAPVSYSTSDRHGRPASTRELHERLQQLQNDIAHSRNVLEQNISRSLRLEMENLHASALLEVAHIQEQLKQKGFPDHSGIHQHSDMSVSTTVCNQHQFSQAVDQPYKNLPKMVSDSGGNTGHHRDFYNSHETDMRGDETSSAQRSHFGTKHMESTFSAPDSQTSPFSKPTNYHSYQYVPDDDPITFFKTSPLSRYPWESVDSHNTLGIENKTLPVVTSARGLHNGDGVQSIYDYSDLKYSNIPPNEPYGDLKYLDDAIRNSKNPSKENSYLRNRQPQDTLTEREKSCSITDTYSKYDSMSRNYDIALSGIDSQLNESYSTPMHRKAVSTISSDNYSKEESFRYYKGFQLSDADIGVSLPGNGRNTKPVRTEINSKENPGNLNYSSDSHRPLAKLANLRKELLYWKDECAKLRKILENKVERERSRKRIEQEYFNATQQRGKVLANIIKTAKETKLDPVKVFKTLKLDVKELTQYLSSPLMSPAMSFEDIDFDSESPRTDDNRPSHINSLKDGAFARIENDPKSKKKWKEGLKPRQNILEFKGDIIENKLDIQQQTNDTTNLKSEMNAMHQELRSLRTSYNNLRHGPDTLENQKQELHPEWMSTGNLNSENASKDFLDRTTQTDIESQSSQSKANEMDSLEANCPEVAKEVRDSSQHQHNVHDDNPPSPNDVDEMEYLRQQRLNYFKKHCSNFNESEYTHLGEDEVRAPSSKYAESDGEQKRHLVENESESSYDFHQEHFGDNAQNSTSEYFAESDYQESVVSDLEHKNHATDLRKSRSDSEARCSEDVGNLADDVKNSSKNHNARQSEDTESHTNDVRTSFRDHNSKHSEDIEKDMDISQVGSSEIGNNGCIQKAVSNSELSGTDCSKKCDPSNTPLNHSWDTTDGSPKFYMDDNVEKWLQSQIDSDSDKTPEPEDIREARGSKIFEEEQEDEHIDQLSEGVESVGRVQESDILRKVGESEDTKKVREKESLWTSVENGETRQDNYVENTPNISLDILRNPSHMSNDSSDILSVEYADNTYENTLQGEVNDGGNDRDEVLVSANHSSIEVSSLLSDEMDANPDLPPETSLLNVLSSQYLEKNSKEQNPEISKNPSKGSDINSCDSQSDGHNSDQISEEDIADTVRKDSPAEEYQEASNEIMRHAPPLSGTLTSTSHISQAPIDCGPAVVIDNGSGMTKAGFATNEKPTVVMPAVIGRPQYEEVMSRDMYKDYYVGDQADHYRGVLKLTYPVEHGIVNDWNDMEKIWDYVFFNKLRTIPSDHPVLLTEPPFNPKRNRERMLEIMMETFDVPAFYVAIQAVLTLYGAGRTTGVVFDSGDGVSHIVPVYDGYSMPYATERVDIAGRDLTRYLMRILMERGYSLKTSAEQEISKDIKEKHCFVALDYEKALEQAERSSELEQSYMLPDGGMVYVNSERFRCPEVLFQPGLLGKDVGGIHEYLHKSITRCDIDVRPELYSNIVLSGGTTMLDGLDKRLKLELSRLCTDKMVDQIKIQSPPDRKFSVWCGGAALASLPTFSQMWITQDEYYECGLDIVHRKCF